MGMPLILRIKAMVTPYEKQPFLVNHNPYYRLSIFSGYKS